MCILFTNLNNLLLFFIPSYSKPGISELWPMGQIRLAILVQLMTKNGFYILSDWGKKNQKKNISCHVSTSVSITKVIKHSHTDLFCIIFVFTHYNGGVNNWNRLCGSKSLKYVLFGLLTEKVVDCYSKHMSPELLKKNSPRKSSVSNY